MRLLILTFAALLCIAYAIPRGAVKPQSQRELVASQADKQQIYGSTETPASASSGALLKVSPQSFAGGPKAGALPGGQSLNYNPHFLAYTPQTISYVPQGLKYASALPEVAFGFSPQYQPQQQLEYSHQAYAPAPQAAGKASAAQAVARIAPSPDSAINFSPASEVSTFKFSSPLVTYSNLGVLSQITGKSASSASNAQAHAAQVTAQSNAAQLAHQQAAYHQSPAPQFVSAAPGSQKLSYEAVHGPQQLAYSAAPQLAFATLPVQQKGGYAAQLPQQLAFALAVPSQQKVLYAQQGAPPPGSRVVYIPAPKQYIAAASGGPQQAGQAAHQFAYSAQPQQQFAYALAAAQPGEQTPSQAAYALPPQYRYSIPGTKSGNSPSNYEQ